MKNESILDHPVEDLDPIVWRKDDSGNHVLTDEAREKISSLVSWACGVLGVSNAEANITGSITSNTFTPESDIDVHIHSSEISEDDAEEKNKSLRKSFEEQYKLDNGDRCFIGEHPLEVYFQSNPFQDLMSVGCYSLERGWLVGPELKSMDYDPYKEYYEEDKKHVESIIGDVRDKILQIYEDAIAYVNSNDEAFKAIDFGRMAANLHDASLLFRQAREFRKVYSSPRSEEEALERRESKEWKIADSAFKLLDKFGYLGILRTFS